MWDSLVGLARGAARSLAAALADPRVRLAAAVVLVLLGLWWAWGWFGTPLLFFAMYKWALPRALRVAVNPHVANVTALAVGLVLYYGVYRLGRRHRDAGLLIFVALLALQSCFLAAGERNRFFDLTTGDPIKYYTVDPLTGEILMFDREIYDPFGQKAKPVTPATIVDYRRQQNSKQFPNLEVPFDRIVNFFDARTGRSLTYYYQDESGYHFFLHPGYDPATGRHLASATPDVVKKARALAASPKPGPSDREGIRAGTSRNETSSEPPGAQKGLGGLSRADTETRINELASFDRMMWEYLRSHPSNWRNAAQTERYHQLRNHLIRAIPRIDKFLRDAECGGPVSFAQMVSDHRYQYSLSSALSAAVKKYQFHLDDLRQAELSGSDGQPGSR